MSAKTKIISDYTIVKYLGKGSYSRVYGGYHRVTNDSVAVKHIRKKSVKLSVLEKLLIEIDILKYINHPNIIHLIDVITSENSIYIVLEYCCGDLSGFIKSNPKGVSETVMSHFAFQLREGLKIFHELDIIHRDLKPQNILMTELTEFATIKIADFGMAKISPELTDTVCGSPMYMAPEIIKGQTYNETVDLWSFGVILWELLTGKVPYYKAHTWAELVTMINKGTRPELPDHIVISPECRDLLTDLLKPQDRIDFNTFYNHPFFAQCEPASWASRDTILPSPATGSAPTAASTEMEDWVVVDSSLISDLKLTHRPTSLEIIPLYREAEKLSRLGVENEIVQDNKNASLYYSKSIDVFQDLLASHNLSHDDKLRVSIKMNCIKERFDKTSFSSNTNE